MSPLTVFALSVSMSVDAFAVAVGRGTALDGPRFSEALRTGAIFGAVEATTPFIGWLFGIAAAQWVADYDHWLAFLLLAGVGLHMIYSAFKSTPDEASDTPRKASLTLLLVTAFGTSIDAMAVGLSLAFIDVDLMGILAVSIGVGLTTFAFATGGMMLGRVIGDRFGKTAEIIAGLVLLAIGTTILIEHLHA